MFDSIFSEKPKYFKHTPSNKNNSGKSAKSGKSNDSLSNKGYSVSSMKGSKYENATAKSKRKKSQFLREVQEIRSEEVLDDFEE